MSNLLKDASILLTPTGYDDGSMNSIKPENGDGDFTFSRNSAATRVNAQGLVENVQIISPELVSNGNFSQEGSELITNGDFATDSDWSKLNATISGGKGNLDGDGQTSLLWQNILTENKFYKATFTISNYNELGSARLINNSGVPYYSITSNGTFTIYFTHSTASGNLLFRAISGATLSIDNVSVKEVGQDWTLGTGWSVDQANSKAIAISSPSGQSVSQNSVASSLSNGSLAQVSFQVLDITQGSFGIYFSGTLVGSMNSVGTFNGTFIKGTETSFYIRALGTTSGSISNISVKEITDDTDLPRINYEGFSYQDSLGGEEVVNGDFATDSNWNKGTGWSIANGSANSDGTNNYDQLRQTNILTIGNSYKLTFDLTYISGLVKFTTPSVDSEYNSSGSYTLNFIADSANVVFTAWGAFTGSIDNVSVKEVLGQEVVPDSGCGSWLLEPQSTNIIPYSEDFSQWAGGNVSIESGYLSPDGTNNATKVTATTPISKNGYLVFSGLSSPTTTRTIYARTTSGTGDIQLLSHNTNTNNVFTVTEQWQRFEVNSTSQIGTNFYAVDFRSNLTTLDEVIIWAAQEEQQSFSTSYIPTNGATSTRLQDIANNSGNSTLINSTEGVLYAEIAALANNSIQRAISLSDGTNTNRIVLLYNDASNAIRLFVQVGGATQASIITTSYTITDFSKIAARWALNDFSLWVDGVEVGTDTSGSTFTSNTLSTLDFDFPAGQAPFFGKNKALAVYKEALTDANLRSLTYPNPVATTFDLDFDTIAEQFTFTRGSEATFVNAQGLIQSTNQIGAEEITNGDFSNGLTDWSVVGGSYASVNNGILNSNNTVNGSWFGQYIAQDVSFVNGKTYKVTFIAKNISGALNLRLTQGANVVANLNLTSEFVSYTYYYTSNADNGSLRLFCNDSIGEFEIDNVSVKEYITATNTPRIDYSTGEKAFLLEPQSTNLITYSEDFSNAYWIKQPGVVATYNTTETLSPDGTYNATKFIGNGSTGVYKASIGVSGVVSRSVYLKSVSGTTTAVFKGPNTNLPAPITLTITNEWQRFELIGDNGSALQGLWIDDITSDGLYMWGAQLEQQSYATSYIPTSGASATRNQELCNNATPVINSEEGTLYAEISALANDGTFRIISLTDGSTSNRVSLIYNTTSNFFRIMVVSSGSTVFDTSRSVTSTLDFHKVAIKYKANDFAVWIDGVEVAIDTSGATPIGLDRITFDVGNGTLNFFGNTKGLKYYPKALADVQLEDLTTI